MRNLWIGAAMALCITSVGYAQPGKGNGNGNGKGNAASAQRGNPGGGQKANRGNGNRQQAQRANVQRGNGNANRGNGNRAVAQRGNGNGNAGVKQRGNGNGNAVYRERGNGNAVVRGNGNANRVVGNGNRGNNDRYVGGGGGIVERTIRYVDDPRGGGYFRTSGSPLIAGCPPGLAKKNNGCQPPGQAKKNGYYDYRPSFFGYSGFNDGRYRYDDGYLLRYNDRGSLLGYLPLLGGALGIGNTWPSTYDSAPLPDYYTGYYDLGPRNSYRYADDVIYRVDPETAAIRSIAALLTGDEFVVGQPMPSGYGAYNVPYGYRDQYYDTPDARYRYADGRIYQIDPTTQLIAAAIDLVV